MIWIISYECELVFIRTIDFYFLHIQVRVYFCMNVNVYTYALVCGFFIYTKIKGTNKNVYSYVICIKESGWKIPSPTVLIIVHSCNREAAASVSAKVTICSEVEFPLLGPSSISMITTKNTFLSSTTLWLWSFHFCVVVFLLKAMQR